LNVILLDEAPKDLTAIEIEKADQALLIVTWQVTLVEIVHTVEHCIM
jgi:hypothetical protein